MTSDANLTHRTPAPDFNDPTGALSVWLEEYRPVSLSEACWLSVAEECKELVKRAGPARRERMKNDLNVLAAGFAVTIERSRPFTLDEVLSEVGLQNLDDADIRSGLAEGTRQNRRGAMRRLQAHYRHMPWRTPRKETRRPPAAVSSPLAEVGRLVEQARDDLRSIVEALATTVRTPQVGLTRGGLIGDISESDWASARQFAATLGVKLTKQLLADAATEKLLSRPEPVAALMAAYKLTRRDLELALPAVDALPERPDAATAAALRGSSQI